MPTATVPPEPALPEPDWQPRTGATIEQLLNVHRATAPSPNANASVVAFLSDASGLAQPYRVDVGTEPTRETTFRRLLTVDDRIQFVRFAPGARHLFYARDRGGDENYQILRTTDAGEQLADLTANPATRTLFGCFDSRGNRFAYAHNDRSRADFDIYVRGVDGAPARRLFDATGHHEAEDFSRDGRTLIVNHEFSGFNNDMISVDVASGRTTLLTAHQGDVRFHHPRFSRDGRSLFLVSDQGRDFMNLAAFQLPAGPVRFLFDENHDVDGFEFSRASNIGAIAVNFDGWHEVRLVDFSPRGAPRVGATVSIPRSVIGAMAFSDDGLRLVLGVVRASMPDEIFVADARTGQAQRVTESDRAGIEERTLVEPTVERVRSFDGVEVPVLLYRPAGMQQGERAPVVVWVHGGPEAQATPNFNAVIQFLVGHGYIVAAPNVRGSTGYGKQYAHLDDVALRENSVRDLAEVNRWLRERPDVHGDRIAVMGGSYGGYMTLAAITLFPDIWAAACDIVGIANFRTFLERTASYRRALREAEYGTLANDGELLDRISPIHRTERIRVPLMVIHGANDPRVPVGEAEQIVSALRARRHRVEYLRFENEGHGLARRENRVRAYTELVRFLDSILTRPRR